MVSVEFARRADELLRLEGPHRYRVGDALITGFTGTRWSVARERFEAKYRAVAQTPMDEDGPYAARPVPVLGRQIHEALSAERSTGGDRLHGQPGDWLLQYGPGDYGVAGQERFARIYRKLP
ncbi:MAG: hypothetical protein HZB40_03275 [Rhodocyclales bacterium]|nr:hypothetical protein [Rhodocyclales bacterium]